MKKTAPLRVRLVEDLKNIQGVGLHVFGDFDAEFGGDSLAVVWVGAEEVAELEHLDFFAGVA